VASVNAPFAPVRRRRLANLVVEQDGQLVGPRQHRKVKPAWRSPGAPPQPKLIQLLSNVLVCGEATVKSGESVNIPVVA
jgi:hypothetical protein